MIRPLVLVCAAAFAVSVVVLSMIVISDSSSSNSRAQANLPRVPRLPHGASTAARIAQLQAMVRARPRDVNSLVSLGASYLQMVRETGDFAYYQRADESINVALKRDDANSGAYTERGVLRLARHDFRGALIDGQHARRLAPQVVKPLGVLVDANVELGHYAAAASALQRMIDEKPNLDSYARVSYFRELHGDIEGARRALTLAEEAGGEAPENAAYVEVLEGNLEFGRGRRQAAERFYRAALQRLPKYVPADFGLARVQAANGQLAKAISRARAIVNRLPLPEYVIFLGETEQAAHRDADAQDDFALVGVEQRLLAAAGVNTDTELAIFQADHGDPRRGVQLGRAAWRLAPSVRSADALGWALTRAGHARDGAAWGRRALRLGSRDATFLYHAGMSAKAARANGMAKRLLARALHINPRFSALFAPRARRALAAL